MDLKRKAAKTIGDIARIAGVSKSTVSRALNDSSLISTETKDRIRAIAKANSFEINAPARRLSLRQSRTIAYAACAHGGDFTVADQFDLEIMSAVADGLAARGYDMLVVHLAAGETDWARSYISSGRVDGFILLAGTSKTRYIEKLLAMNAPFVAWGTPLPGRHYCTVCGDDEAGGRLAAGHLVETGRRRIVFLGGPETESEVHRRREGFTATLAAMGHPLADSHVAYGDYADFNRIAAAMRCLLDRVPDLDAVFATADLIAIIAMDVLRQSGRRVPEDVAVIGYDGLSLTAITNPPLTTIRQNISVGGHLLADTLIAHLETGVVANRIIPAQLLVRQSA